ncbi:hypothetical protein NEOLEDRAFT_1130825 [Neolentinus lepideus HHB14362 ss-1]|uniref:Uncharacterized protein n=1 Tax=Neolentinus lepideus HHB14362 ss-1 TaxID=1314782 RepID=A0A165TWW9_9AGAM|nr:hypothetical protein NEOLEDRAFT_1130825 [Neolentinus lepideus HHB14362 ss-1]
MLLESLCVILINVDILCQTFVSSVMVKHLHKECLCLPDDLSADIPSVSDSANARFV